MSKYYIQEARYKWNNDYPHSTVVRYYDKGNVERDYESWVGELGVSYAFPRNLETGLDMRVLSYYGGVLDSALEGFHAAFGFPNGAREYFLRNQVYVNIPTNNGITLFLDKPAVSFGDMDLWGKWTFFQNSRISLAGLGAFKLPTGTLKNLSGSGYPDLALGVISDIRALRMLTVYVQAGLVLPFNMKSYPMFNGMAGLELHPWKFLSFNLQMNIKSSPISNDIPAERIFSSSVKQYSLPQTNILAGFIVRHKNFKWQFYAEEDALTGQGADITFNLMFTHNLILNK